MVNDYGMFTDSGNNKVQLIVDKVFAIANVVSVDSKIIYEALTYHMNEAAKNPKYSEIWDTEVRCRIIDTLASKLNRNFTIYF